MPSLVSERSVNVAFIKIRKNAEIQQWIDEEKREEKPGLAVTHWIRDISQRRWEVRIGSGLKLPKLLAAHLGEKWKDRRVQLREDRIVLVTSPHRKHSGKGRRQPTYDEDCFVLLRKDD